MKEPRKPFRWVLFSFFCAFMLEIVPLPLWGSWFRPSFTLLLLIYWILREHPWLSIEMSWGIGLLLDVLHGTALGAYALAFVLVAFITFRFQRRMWLYPMWQQSVMVGFLSVVYLMVLIGLPSSSGHVDLYYFHWMMPLCNALLWPLVFTLGETYWCNARVKRRPDKILQSLK